MVERDEIEARVVRKEAGRRQRRRRGVEVRCGVRCGVVGRSGRGHVARRVVRLALLPSPFCLRPHTSTLTVPHAGVGSI
jgi:hypothetical protein